MDRSCSSKTMRGARTPHCFVMGLRLSSRTLDVAVNGKVTDIYPCDVGTFMRTASSVFYEPWGEGQKQTEVDDSTLRNMELGPIYISERRWRES